MKYSKNVFLSFLLSFLLGEPTVTCTNQHIQVDSLPGVGVGGATLISAKGCHASNDAWFEKLSMFNFSNHA